MGYGKSAPYYDLFGEKSDLEYYAGLGSKYESALEIGVGTGRVVLEMARENVRVWGIDNCQEMLEVAHKKIAAQPEDIRTRIVLLQEDMTSFHLERAFPFIYIPSSTFSHCTTTEEQLHCLDCIYDHLEEKGKFVFDLVLPRQSYSAALTLIDRKDMDDTVILRWICHRPDFTEQLLHTILVFEIYKNQTLTERIVESSTVGLIYKRELLLLLDKAGFTIDNIYGDFLRNEKITDFVVVEASKK